MCPNNMALRSGGRDSNTDCLLVSLPVLLHDVVIHWLGWELLGGGEDVDPVETEEVSLDDLEVLDVTEFIQSLIREQVLEMDSKEVSTIELVPVGEADLPVVPLHPLAVNLVESFEHIVDRTQEHTVQWVWWAHQEHHHGLLTCLELDGDVLAAVELSQLLLHASAAPDPLSLLGGPSPLPQPQGVVLPDALRRPHGPVTPVTLHTLPPLLVVPGGGTIGARVMAAMLLDTYK